MKARIIALAAVATAIIAAPAAFAATKPAAAPATASAPAKTEATPAKAKHHKKMVKKSTGAAPAAAH